MRNSGHAAALCTGLFIVHSALVSADTPAVPKDLLRARPAAWTNPLSRCPDLRQADPAEGNVAVVALHVGSTGVPSQASIKTSSGSAQLDNAALACVSKLKFQPATGTGDGGPIDSWQQIAWRNAKPTAAAAAPSATPAAASAATVPASAPAAGVAAAAGAGAVAAGAGVAAAAPASGAAVHSASAEVRACVDADGKLTQEPSITRSSGDAAFDAAAVAIAKAGSGHYRPGVSGQSAAPCLLLTIRTGGP